MSSIKQKLILMTSMLLVVVSMCTLCFSIAWYALFPTYTDLVLQTGDYPLIIKNRTFLRSYEYGADPSDPTKMIPTKSLGGVLGKDYNYKAVNSGKKTVVNDVVDGAAGSETLITHTAGGGITINFPALNFDLFKKPTTGTDNNVDDHILDSNLAHAVDLDYFTFFFSEFTFVKRFFSAYVSAQYSFSAAPNTSSTNLSSTDEVGKLNVTNLIKLRKFDIRDDAVTTPEEKLNKVTFINDPYLPSTTEFEKANMKALKKFDTSKFVDDGKESGQLFTGYTPKGDPSKISTNQIEIKSNPQVTDIVDSDNTTRTVPCFAHAFAVALYINPIYLFDWLRSDTSNTLNSNDTFTVKLALNFTASNVEILK